MADEGKKDLDIKHLQNLGVRFRRESCGVVEVFEDQECRRKLADITVSELDVPRGLSDPNRNCPVFLKTIFPSDGRSPGSYLCGGEEFGSEELIYFESRFSHKNNLWFRHPGEIPYLRQFNKNG